MSLTPLNLSASVRAAISAMRSRIRTARAVGDMAADDDDGKHASDGKDDDDGNHKDATQDGARLSAQDAWQAQLMHQENSGGLCLRVRVSVSHCGVQ